jgi:hypothetical protein
MRDDRLSQGFSAGNYCNAYETDDYDKAIKQRDLLGSGEDFATAFIMGFFASYELHEIPSTHKIDFGTAYHSAAGRRVLELGYCDPRKEESDADNNTGDTA